MCVDISFDEAGTVQKLVNDAGVWGKKLSGRELADAVSAGERLFTLHAATCPSARKHNPKPEGLEIDWAAAPSRRR